VLHEAVSFGTKGKMPLDKTAWTCAQRLKLEPALWTFAEQPGVEATNNAAERAIRPAILWRKVFDHHHFASSPRPECSRLSHRCF
jgi:Transposase IS66 family